MKPARTVSKKQALLTSPPKGYLSVRQAAAASTWQERQLRRYIGLGHLPVVIIAPAPGPQRGPGRKTTQWISPDALAELKLMTRKKKAPASAATAPPDPGASPKSKKPRAAAAQIAGGDGDATRN